MLPEVAVKVPPLPESITDSALLRVLTLNVSVGFVVEGVVIGLQVIPILLGNEYAE